MLSDAVIPERDVVDLPTPAYREFRAAGLFEQVGQYGPTLLRSQLVDVGREPFVDEQGLAAAHRMGPNHRVSHRRVLGYGALVALLERRVVLPAFGRKGFRDRVLGRQAGQKITHARGKRVIRGATTRPQRVAAGGRNSLGG